MRTISCFAHFIGAIAVTTKNIAATSAARDHRAVELVKNNTDAVEVNSEAIVRFVAGREFYSNYSHPSKMTVASRLIGEDGDSWLIGGHFDEARM